MDTPVQINQELSRKRLERYIANRGLQPTNIPSLEDANKGLNELASLSLQPDYTIPVLCFYRPLKLELVARWTINHLHYSPSTVVSSLGRIVSIFPESAPLTEHFLAQNDRYKSLLKQADNEEELKETLLALYRFLNFDRERFAPFVEPVTLYSILNAQFSTSVVHYLTLKILADYLEAPQQARDEWVQRIDDSSPVFGVYEGRNNIDYLFTPLLEAKRISEGQTLLQSCTTDLDSKELFFNDNSSTRLLCNLGGVLVPRLTPETAFTSTFVATKSAIESVRKLGNALTSSKPILLTGLPGSGKTFYIDETAKRFSKYDQMVRIHLGDQSDAKILMGTYSTGEQPGSFEWCPGILTKAVQEGRWVLIEDIDKAPTEILSVLLSILEKRELLIPSRGEVIKAQRGFQIFATMRSFSSKSGEEMTPDLIGKRLWEVVHVPVPENEELKSILKHRFPLLQNLADSFVDTYFRVQDAFSHPKFFSMNKSSQNRPISTRDLMKWAQRVQKMLENVGVTEEDVSMSSEVFDDMFAEAVDCFAGFLQSPKATEHITYLIGDFLEIPTSRIQLLLRKHIPSFTETDSDIRVGRAVVSKSLHVNTVTRALATQRNRFALTNHSRRLIERLSVAVSMKEPLLLVGETGTGKTTVVQYLANVLNKRITVINVSQQTETSDLLGGYKPVDAKMIAVPLREEFDVLFDSTFSAKKNVQFTEAMKKYFDKQDWRTTVKLWRQAVKMAKEALAPDTEGGAPKKKRRLDSAAKSSLAFRWNDFSERVDNFEVQAKQVSNSFFFSFVEGSLVQAIRRGDWVLLDEINLASPDTLESISDLLVENPSITLSERGDAESIKAHPDFRLFACMNPATDIGKKDIPTGLRSRFTELFVSSPDQDIGDLLSIIGKYVGNLAMKDEWVAHDVAELYLEAKKLAEENKIVDGANQKPHFSIRTLSRTLIYAATITHIYGLRRSLYEGFCMSFLTLLDQSSEKLLHPVIQKYTLERLKNMKSIISQIPPQPKDGHEYSQFRHYWLRKGGFTAVSPSNYILTPFVERNLLNLARATAGRLFPILIQGPTSSGKTSMIKYLASCSGNKFVRINNHEHTDLQEYLGTYVSDERGQLKFQEGVLVEALRNGYWIVLDELNLAPTDVLEALNRLLDDNRELLIPETQEVVKPHPDFMLFATQNPPGVYGGRKMLSRAFRNRFLELHFDDIPQDELETILRQRCQIAPSYSKKIVDVYRKLSVQRQSTRLFEQKNSFATLRDLFRWAGREAVGYEQLALNGYMLLGERVRKREEREVVKQAIEEVMRVEIDVDREYSDLEPKQVAKECSSVVWTKSMRRLLVLVSEAMKNNEPVLLVGETGCGKTTICQVLASALGKELHIVNAHQNTETGDIIGAQRPVRNRSEYQAQLASEIKYVLEKLGDEYSQYVDADLEALQTVYKTLDDSQVDSESSLKIKELTEKLKILFEWSDGSLIQAMKTGEFFLMDEISLADDSVLERLNSVLEPERTVLLSEKGANDASLTAADGFKFFATMNPGGDYGKKELSPALRNRFTEIWVPSMEDFDDVLQIIESKLKDNLKRFSKCIAQFGEWFGKTYGGGDASSGIVSLRDILSWVSFVNTLSSDIPPELSLFHGACMVFIDSVGSNSSASLAQSPGLLYENRKVCVRKLSELSDCDFTAEFDKTYSVEVSEKFLKIGPFSLQRSVNDETKEFNLAAPTTAKNALRVLRGMQAKKPILLEGSPGVGKTSLITAISGIVGRPLTRINLSEQTDLIDLFGADAPAEGKNAGEFVWRDAPFLRAMQQGDWVLLDEMNLASQSVLEGLNACLDHRGETYIPELDKSFKCHPDFTVFAAQNPQHQGGGRKGLPKSFVNRFSVVYVDTLSMDDLKIISEYLYPTIDKDIIANLIGFVLELEQEVSEKRSFGNLGSPFEFNLRDTMRWLKLLNQKSGLSKDAKPSEFLGLVATDRFRTETCRERAKKLYEKYFGPIESRDVYYQIGKTYVQFGNSLLAKVSDEDLDDRQLQPLQCNISLLETATTCVKNSWPLILVGPTNSGKTSLIRFLANMVGTPLHEFSMNGDIDSTDLLGGFDQVDVTHKSAALLEKARELCRHICLFSLVNGSRGVTEAFERSSAILTVAENKEKSSQTMRDLLSVFEDIPGLSDELNEEVSHFKNNVRETIVEMAKVQTVRFRWFDGTLLTAVEQGHWLVLDNANLCNPSVLDRLNSLLEPGGSLIVNECSLENGEPRVVIPHKNFRLFLTVDPKYGELSRAMRNRGVEVFMDDLDSRATAYDQTLMEFKRMACSETLEDTLEGLKLESSASPVSKYMKATDSMNRYFGLLEDVSFASQGCPSFVANASLDVLPLRLTNTMVERWSGVLQSSGFFSNSSKAVSKELVSKVQYLRSNSYEELVKSLCSEAMLSSGVEMEEMLGGQPVNMQVNTYFSRYTDNCSSTYDLFYVLQLLQALQISSKQLEAAILSVDTAKPSEMSYFVKSAAAYKGKMVKAPAMIPVFETVRAITVYVSDVVQLVVSGSMALDSVNWIAMVELHRIGSDLLMLTNAKSTDESQLHVYGEILRSWFHKMESVPELDTLRPLTESVSKFSTHLELGRGNSMTRIWEFYRGRFPTTGERWTMYDKVLQLSFRFDCCSAKLFPDSIEWIEELRNNIIVIMMEILSMTDLQVLEDAVEKIESGVQKLETLEERFQTQRTHLFHDIFYIITLCLELSAFEGEIGCQLIDRVFDLAYYSQNSTARLASYKIGDFGKPYPPLLKAFWRESDGNDTCYVDELMSDGLMKKILTKLSEFDSISASKFLQASGDLQNLGRQLVKNTDVLLSEKLSSLSNILMRMMSDVDRIHATSSEDEKEKYDAVATKYFKPAIEMLSAKLDTQSVGTAWIYYSLGMMLLYVPDSPFDPAIREHVYHNRAVKASQEGGEHLQARRIVKEVFFGPGSNSIETLISKLLPGDEVSSQPATFRPSPSLISNLFHEWSSLMSSSMGEDTLLQLLSSDRSQRELWQKNTSQFLVRTGSKYSHYSDITTILDGFIYSAKLGISLISMDSTSWFPHWLSDPISLSRCGDLHEAATEAEGKFKGVKSSLFKQYLIHIMDAASLHRNEEVELAGSIGNVLSIFHRQWTAKKLREEQEEAVKTSIYEMKEDDYEEDFKRMFPDYEGEVPVEASSAEDDELDFQLALSYMNLYGGNSDLSLDQLVKRGMLVMQKFELSNSSHHEGMVRTMPSVISSIRSCISGSTQPSDTSFNFYHDANHGEALRVVTYAHKVKQSAFNLLQQWPEHQTLQNIHVACSELLEYPVKTPLARFLQKVEQILMLLHEWEKYANKNVSLSSLLNDISSLIVSWRRLELSTWPRLFEFEQRMVEKELGRWWYYLYESIIVKTMDFINHSDDEEVKSFPSELVKALSVFLSESLKGQFFSRLALLKSFKKHVDFIAEAHKEAMVVAAAVENVITFYEQYTVEVGSQLEKGTAELKKEVEEVILLASWKDTTVEALRDSAKRSHHKLYKLIRKYRAMISDSVKPIVESAPSRPSDKSLGANFNQSIRVSSLPDDVEYQRRVFLKSATVEKKDILVSERTVSKLHQIVESFESQDFITMEATAEFVVAESERLRKETPSIMNDETKKLVASLRVEKGKLLSDTLKYFKQSGLPTTVKVEVATTQHLISDILASTPALGSRDFNLGNAYFFRVLEMLPRLRSAVVSSESDVPAADLERAMAISENVTARILEARHDLAEIKSDYDSVSRLVDCFHAMCSTKSTVLVQLADTNGTRELARKIVNWVPQMMDYALSVCKDYAFLGGIDNSSLGVFANSKSKISELSSAFGSFKGFRVLSRMPEEELEAYKELVKRTVSISDEINSWVHENPLYASVCNPIVKWLNDSAQELNSQLVVVESPPSSIEELEKSVQELCSSILVVFQEVHKMRSNFNVSEDDKWLSQTRRYLQRLSKSLHRDKLLLLLQNCLQRASTVNGIKTAIPAISVSLPFVSQYGRLCHIITAQLNSNYSDLSKSSYQLLQTLYQLSVKGFCTPQEKQEEEDSGKAKEGTGLGDGEGMQNNSEDLDQDDDLTEHAQKKNEEKGDDNKDENDEDNAVDIEGDMEGDLEDASNQSENEKDDKDEDNDELDEETGDIGDLDPNAVDEKMWNEEPDDKKDEKQSEQMPDGNKQENQPSEDQEDNSNEQNKDNEDEHREREESKADDDGEEVEDIGEQEDDIRHQEDEELEQQAEEGEALQLPEDMNIDEGEEGEGEGEEGNVDDMDDTMDDFENEEPMEQKESEDQSGEHDLNSDGEEEQEDGDQEAAEGETNDAESMSEGEGGEDEEQPRDANDEKHEDNSKTSDANEAMNVDTEGLHGPDDAQDEEVNPEESTAGQKDSASKGEGANEVTDEEQDNMEDGTGTSAAKAEKTPEEERVDSNDQARKDAVESLKQLGDALKEFHKRRREIQERSLENDQTEQSANRNPEAFEHVEGEQSSYDTQALGAASQEQVQPIDDNMAIEEDDVKDLEENSEAHELHDVKKEDDSTEKQADNTENEFNDMAGQTAVAGKNIRSEVEEDVSMSEVKDEADSEEGWIPEHLRDAEEIHDTLVPSRGLEESRELWKHYESATQELALGLCEQLRLILEPTLATKLRGDFKTGKRLNMKRIIPYIASQFKKDKIWMRRTKPSKRQYQIMISIDDSKSMAESQSVDLAFRTIALVSKALTQLESGQIAITRFGNETQLVHPFEKPFTFDSGAEVVQWFGFEQQRTDVSKLLEHSIKIFEDAKSASRQDLWQLEIIISDGMCEDHDRLRRLVRRAQEERIMMVFVIIDSAKNDGSSSILDMRQVNYAQDEAGNMKLKMEPYLNKFPFDFYVIVRDIRELPGVLSLVLRQYFAEVSEA